jgi:hypothetical protein
VFISLSTATFPIKKSTATAMPTAIIAQTATVKPKFHPEVVVTWDHKAAVTIRTARIAKKVYCINRFLDIGLVMCGAGFIISSFEDSLILLTFSNEDVYLRWRILNSFGIEVFYQLWLNNVRPNTFSIK